MSGLHTMGHRPAPGKRVDAECQVLEGDDRTRTSWRISWEDIRSEPDLADDMDELAKSCLDARDTPDPLLVAAGRRLGLPTVVLGDTRRLATIVYMLSSERRAAMGDG